MGKGDGTFDPGLDVRVGTTPIAIGDLDRDGLPDLVANSELASSSALEAWLSSSE